MADNHPRGLPVLIADHGRWWVVGANPMVSQEDEDRG